MNIAKLLDPKPLGWRPGSRGSKWNKMTERHSAMAQLGDNANRRQTEPRREWYELPRVPEQRSICT